MNIAHTPPRHDAGAAVVTTDTMNGLYAIRDPGCAAAIWQRAPAPGFQDWIDGLAPDALPSARLVLRPEAVPDALTRLGDTHGLPTGSERDWLEADIAELANRFATVMRAPYLRLRLDVVTTNACAKFHMDAIFARLVCSYRGTGTQYGLSPDGADPDPVETLPACAPIVMRGSLWPAKTSETFLHRSPPIAGTGETRLLLVLDPIFDVEDA